MANTVQKSFRLPPDVASELEAKGNTTEYVVAALREKFFRDEEERFRESARRIAASPAEDRSVEYALEAQAEIVLAR
jgi:hypothetical protein